MRCRDTVTPAGVTFFRIIRARPGPCRTILRTTANAGAFAAPAGSPKCPLGTHAALRIQIPHRAWIRRWARWLTLSVGCLYFVGRAALPRKPTFPTACGVHHLPRRGGNEMPRRCRKARHLRGCAAHAAKALDPCRALPPCQSAEPAVIASNSASLRTATPSARAFSSLLPAASPAST